MRNRKKERKKEEKEKGRERKKETNIRTSIFIASMIISGAPLVTVCPPSTNTLMIFPGIGESKLPFATPDSPYNLTGTFSN
jgi:hypothetical protein